MLTTTVVSLKVAYTLYFNQISVNGFSKFTAIWWEVILHRRALTRQARKIVLELSSYRLTTPLDNS